MTKEPGFLAELWQAVKTILTSKTVILGAVSVVLPVVCKRVGCNVIEVEHTLAVFLGWCLKDGATKLGYIIKTK